MASLLHIHQPPFQPYGLSVSRNAWFCEILRVHLHIPSESGSAWWEYGYMYPWRLTEPSKSDFVNFREYIRVFSWVYHKTSIPGQILLKRPKNIGFFLTFPPFHRQTNLIWCAIIIWAIIHENMHVIKYTIMIHTGEPIQKWTDNKNII